MTHPTAAFAWADAPAMLAFIGQTAFARIVAPTPSGLRVAHVPVIVTSDGAALRFHLANANALASHIEGRTALAIVEGPNAYLSANWYEDVRGAVPTWNYVAVECEGVVTRLGRDALVDLLDELARLLEPRVGEDWTRAKMEPRRFEAMLSAITAFELRIDGLRGTRKLSQNKSGAELAGVLRGFEASGASGMAAAIRATGK